MQTESRGEVKKLLVFCVTTSPALPKFYCVVFIAHLRSFWFFDVLGKVRTLSLILEGGMMAKENAWAASTLQMQNNFLK